MEENGGSSDPTVNVGEYSQVALPALAQAVKRSNTLPASGDDYDYYTSFKGYRQVMKVEQGHIMDIMQTILKQTGMKVHMDVSDPEEMYDMLVEINDSLLERVGSSLDEAQGIKKKDNDVVLATVRSAEIKTSWNKKKWAGQKHPIHLLAAKNVQRPQLKFQDQIDNSLKPFIPIIKDKPNSIRPLAIFLEEGDVYCHPYKCELDHFQPTPEQLLPVTPTVPNSLELTPYEYIDQPVQLQLLLNDLMCQKEFAVDLEHHSYRSFLGITCLMQISTRNKDYIVDTLELRSCLHILNLAFTDPKIVKVFHGSDSDMDWLQRDFGIYVVNMFDTGQAARVMNMARFSLAFLLAHYCKVESDKQYQLADWRIRPLPAEMVNYAREDTHYLLYVYDLMKNELIEKANGLPNLLCSVIQRSKVITEKRYEKPIVTEDSYMELYKKSRKVFNSRQMFALRQLYSWRDKMARQEDESIGYILPNHMLLQIAEVLPREQQGLLACCNPVPPILKQNLHELHEIVLKAKEQLLVKTVVQQLQIQVAKNQLHVDLDNPLHCPHDLCNGVDAGPGLLESMDAILQPDPHQSYCVNVHSKSHPSISIMDSPPSSPEQKPETDTSYDERQNIHRSLNAFTSPYQRFKLMQPFEKAFQQSEPVDQESEDKQRIERLHEYFKQLTANTEVPSDEEDKVPSSEVDSQVNTVDTVDPLFPEGLSLQQIKNEERKRKLKEEQLDDKESVEELPVPEKSQNGAMVIDLSTDEDNPSPKPYSEVNPCNDFRDSFKEEKVTKKRKRKKKNNQQSNINVENMEEGTFKPFDYSEQFALQPECSTGPGKQRTNKKSRKGQGKFGPGVPAEQNERKKRQKNKAFQRGQNKQTTYTQGGPSTTSTSKPRWPKR